MAHYFQGANRFHIANLSISHSTHTFNGKHILGRNPRVAEETTFPAIEKLAEHASAGASFDSKQRYPAPQCFPGTQGNVLEDIRTWFSRTPTDQPILWLYGPTGMGKTTIAQTVAEEVEALAKLVATFFFSRSSPDRNDASKFVATIALQMALKIPHIRKNPDSKLDPVGQNLRKFERVGPSWAELGRVGEFGPAVANCKVPPF
jgi:hypothetical protein